MKSITVEAKIENVDKVTEFVIEMEDNPPKITLIFIDQGTPYNPLENKDPDITLDIEDREIGGLGIFLVKKTMDELSYEYVDGQNILTMKKELA